MESNSNHDAKDAGLSEAYMLSLASLGLSRLQNEPRRLQGEAYAVDDALHSLSLDNYGVFIVNQDCVRHVKSRGADMAQHLNKLTEGLEGLADGFSSFQKEAAELLAGHKRNRQTLGHHNQLVELLEVPQLMDACVRNPTANSGYSNAFEEALSLAAFTQSLERRHEAAAVAPYTSTTDTNTTTTAQSTVPAVVRLIAQEVRQSLVVLRERILQQLRGNVSLSACLQLVSCLRRLEQLQSEAPKHSTAKLMSSSSAGLSDSSRSSTAKQTANTSALLLELKLKIEFLEARDEWLQTVIDDTNYSINGSNSTTFTSTTDLSESTHNRHTAVTPYSYMVDVIEKCRNYWYEIATQYKAVFSADNDAVLSTWLSRRVQLFTDLLAQLLPAIDDGASIRSLLEQSMSFAVSMGRLGADFRGLLIPIFEDAVWSSITSQWKTAQTEFESSIAVLMKQLTANKQRQLTTPTKSSVSSGSSSVTQLYQPKTSTAHMTNNDTLLNDTSASSSGGVYDHELKIQMPPSELLDYPLLARFLNTVLTSLNQLRECAPVSLDIALQEHLLLCIESICAALLQYVTAIKSTVTADKPYTATDACKGCKALATLVLPHISSCYCAIYSSSNGNSSNGNSNTELTNKLVAVMVDTGLWQKEPIDAVGSIKQQTTVPTYTYTSPNMQQQQQQHDRSGSDQVQPASNSNSNDDKQG
eukprot:11261-Heterococcus_DN1.PRE.2